MAYLSTAANAGRHSNKAVVSVTFTAWRSVGGSGTETQKNKSEDRAMLELSSEIPTEGAERGLTLPEYCVFSPLLQYLYHISDFSQDTSIPSSAPATSDFRIPWTEKLKKTCDPLLIILGLDQTIQPTIKPSLLTCHD